MLLEVLLARAAQLHGNELEAAHLEARDDGTNEATLGASVSETHSIDGVTVYILPYSYLDAIGLDRNETEAIG